MSDPTWAEKWTQIKNNTHIWEELEKYASGANGPVALSDTLVQSLETDYGDEIMATVRSLRTSLSGTISPQAIRAGLLPHLRDLAKVIGVPERDGAAIMVRLYQYMVDNSETLNYRNMTFGSPTAGGGNVGDGLMHRLTTPKDSGFFLESVHLEAHTAECIDDNMRTSEHEEVFELRGAEAETDFLAVKGSGHLVRRRALSARDSQSFVRNPSFSSFSGTQPTAGVPSTPSATTSVTGWTLATAASARVGIDTPAVYRDFLGDSTPKWLQFTDNNTATQVFQDNAKPTFSRDAPYYCQVAVYRESNCDGTLTIRFGASSVATNMTTLNNSAWNIIKIAIGTGSWVDNFQENSADIQIQLASRTTGTALFDDILVAPFFRVPGDESWYIIVGGATPFQRGDTFTWTDAEAGSRGVLQYWLGFRSGYLLSLPSTAGAETITDP